MYCCGSCLCWWRQADGGDVQRRLTELTEVMAATESTETAAAMVFALSLSVSVEAGCQRRLPQVSDRADRGGGGGGGDGGDGGGDGLCTAAVAVCVGGRRLTEATARGV